MVGIDRGGEANRVVGVVDSGGAHSLKPSSKSKKY